jgi:regulatory protein
MGNQTEKLAAEPEELKQKCFDSAVRLLTRRPHGLKEISIKLRKKFEASTVQSIVDRLVALKILDDENFARMQAGILVRKKIGKGRAKLELMKRGVDREIIERVIGEVYAANDPAKLAREFAMKKLVGLRRLEPMVARRRLFGALMRRGFNGEVCRTVVKDLLGNKGEWDGE